ncbi:MAG: glycosyltransferase, partial [Candidatus Aminicenantes bacterium]|nr:glycosyltransferase [Candidatus Aminicenantes bacterium]
MITVLMSVFNNAAYLREAIDSILNQTYTDFEFLIIDDASTDSSKEIISHYHDTRIRLIENKRNIGLTKSLNKGLHKAKGEYIARMDADDISLPDRLAVQYAFLQENPDA